MANTALSEREIKQLADDVEDRMLRGFPPSNPARLGDTVQIYWNRTIANLETQAEVDCYNSHGDIYPLLLRDECLIRILKPERMTVTGRLWIPESAQREDYEMFQAVVLATGHGRRKKKNGEIDPMEVKVGDHVLVFWHHVTGASGVRYAGRDDLRIIAQWQMQLHWPGNLTLSEAMR